VSSSDGVRLCACSRAATPGGPNLSGRPLRGNVLLLVPHPLRATFVTHALANGASVRDVQAIVGHSDPGLTMRIYAQTTNQGRRAAIDALPFVTSTPALRIASGD
jgi:integrase